MDLLLKRKKVCKSKITRLLTYCSGRSDFSSIEAGVQMEKVKLLDDELNLLFEQVAQECVDEEFEQYESEFADLSQRLCELKITLLSVNDIQGHRGSIQIHAQAGVCGTDLRLPKIELPTFSGAYEEWLTFKDLFEASIHNNVKLGGAQKLQYLKSALKGDAARVIQSIPITNDNYVEAWSLLFKRYQNIREIVNSHLDRLMSQPSVQANAPQTLRRLVDITNECVRAIHIHGVPTEHWSVILVYMITKLLDSATRREWELSIKKDEFPKFEQLMDFLDLRAHALLAGASSNKGTVLAKSRKDVFVHHGTIQGTCNYCESSHSIYKCPQFGKLSVQERRTEVKAKGLCFNCLKKGHQGKQCTSFRCRKCKSAHNTLLHVDVENPAVKVINTDVLAVDNSQTVTNLLSRKVVSSYVLLSTAMIQVKGPDHTWHEMRALLDSASQSSFITQKAVKGLGLRYRMTQVMISGLGGCNKMVPRGAVQLNCRSYISQAKSFTVHALVLSNISHLQPLQELKKDMWSHLDHLILADPKYYQPGEIDILLGADIYAELLEGGVCKGPPNTPTGIQTSLGWILLGNIGAETPGNEIISYISQVQCDEWIHQFWEVPEESKQGCLSLEEEECEKHFALTYSRSRDGRFMVQLPIKKQSKALGSSRAMAVARFKHQEQRLHAKPELYKQYKEFMDEYLALRHMEKVPQQDKLIPVDRVYYLPHHAVVNLSSTSTKLRVVFDASARTSTGISLNDILLVGPKLQTDILPLLLRFRMHVVALMADIKKMYRQICMHPNDVNFLRIVWRNSPEEELRDYRLLTVTYGTSSAPYQATKCLQQLAYDEKSVYPRASQILLSDFYVDDLLTGAATEEEAISIQEDLQALLARGGFDLCKWATNNKRVQASIPRDKLETLESCHIGDTPTIKALGIRWSPGEDTFAYAWVPEEIEGVMTRRKLLSIISKVYDPLGLISPVTVRAKLLFQSVWKLNLGWDEPLPDQFQKHWTQYNEDLVSCQKLKVNRLMILPGSKNQEIHAFCDASEKAYAAVVYMKTWTRSDHAKVSLVVAKTRVAPLKTQTLPRLELCGAVLLANLVKVVRKALQVPTQRIFLYTDSTVVLAWIRAEPTKWKQFVANRVSEIQKIIPAHQWQHIESEKNPADCASRGITSKLLFTHSLWWEGPERLRQEGELENSQIMQYIKEDFVQEELNKEKKKPKLCLYNVCSVPMLETWSSLEKTKRITAWCQRFIYNCRAKGLQCRSGPLAYVELQEALNHWIKKVQIQQFGMELEKLNQNQAVSSTSSIRSLNPFLDPKGIIRVGGRLRNAKILEQAKYPILLPAKNHLTNLIVRHEHERTLHAGPQLTQASILQQFWIINIRSIVRKYVKTCITCQRLRAKVSNQLMGDLPESRVNPSKPFSHCGVDCGGPFLLKGYRKRGGSPNKAYICLFVCFATKAVHIEILTSLRTTAFIACLRRFSARRGYPAHLYSDCGTNFVGADVVLRKWLKDHIKNPGDEQLDNYITQNGMRWHFNPPSAPHFGGLWEAGIKAFKGHFIRVVGKTPLTLEELMTVSTQIEACLNSRPLTALSMDPQDLSVLTPGHFLIGEPLLSLPDGQVSLGPTNRLSRWELCQKLVTHFWKRWKREYLTQLQQRSKWKGSTANIQVGQIAIIKDDNLKPLFWKLGCIIEMHSGQDGLVRTVTLRTANGQLMRPIVKLAILPTDGS